MLTKEAGGDNLTIYYNCKKQIDISFSCICPVMDNKFCHKIVNVVCRSTWLSPCGSTATLTMLWQNSGSITGQMHERQASNYQKNRNIYGNILLCSHEKANWTQWNQIKLFANSSCNYFAAERFARISWTFLWLVGTRHVRIKLKCSRFFESRCKFFRKVAQKT